MDLFNTDAITNLLPYDGETLYYGAILDSREAQRYYHKLLTDIDWRNDEAIMFGRHLITKRKVAWYGDRAFSYTYSRRTKQALPWTKELLELKARVEKISDAPYNSCLLNLYHTGEEGMAWHSDDEKALGPNSAIASLSLGAVRKFCFKHKQNKEVVSVMLTPGSLLVMQGTTQTHWLHRLPPTKRVTQARINLTFRTMVG